MEKAITSHRWLLENCNRREDAANYLIQLSRNFNRFKKYKYTIEVLEGSIDMTKTVEDEAQAETNLITAYIECGEFLKAKGANETRRSTDCWYEGLQSGRIEDVMCNYGPAIDRFREVVTELQKQDNDDSLSVSCSVTLARTLLQHSAANEDEAITIFQEELDRCIDPIRRVEILFHMGAWYRELNKFDQSIETLHQLCLNSTRTDGKMLLQANEAMAQTYLEQYCNDTTLTINQRTHILRHATEYSVQVDEDSTEMQLILAQLFYFHGKTHEAYGHLELYLDARSAACKLTCYTCEQWVRHGSVPFSCASCRVASYCDRKHQKMTWKNEPICHRVLCPLLGYWRVSKKKLKKSHELTTEDRHEYERVFDTFFKSICPHGLIIVDDNVQKAFK